MPLRSKGILVLWQQFEGLLLRYERVEELVGADSAFLPILGLLVEHAIEEVSEDDDPVNAAHHHLKD